jgi:hypothetical protein
MSACFFTSNHITQGQQLRKPCEISDYFILIHGLNIPYASRDDKHRRRASALICSAETAQPTRPSPFVHWNLVFYGVLLQLVADAIKRVLSITALAPLMRSHGCETFKDCGKILTGRPKPER